MADQETYGAAGRTPQGELARRLHLLLDITAGERGRPLLFSEISEAMAARSVKLSRARWNYMKDGNGRLIRDRPLLAALADFFNVDHEFLLSVEDLQAPELTAAQLESVKSLRAERAKSFAAKTLGDVSPETLEATIDHLDQDVALNPEDAIPLDERDTPDEHPGAP